MNCLFLHGLDSTGYGTKGHYFADRFPDMLRPDFTGSLEERLTQLRSILEGRNDIILVGSSFGGLMAAIFALSQPKKVKRLILLAPALNFTKLPAPPEKLAVETFLFIGNDDAVTPPNLVIPAAEALFANLKVQRFADDHLLHKSFETIDWPTLLHPVD